MCGCFGELKTFFSNFALKIVVKMGKVAFLNQVKMAQILTLHKEGYAECKICVKLYFSKTAIHNVIMNVKNNGTFNFMGRSGHPRKRIIRDDYMMRGVATHSPSSSYKMLHAALLVKGTNVSLIIVSRRLSNEFGLKSHKPACKPHLTI